MKNLQYIRPHIEYGTTQIAHYNAFIFERYEQFAYTKCFLQTYRMNKIR